MVTALAMSYAEELCQSHIQVMSVMKDVARASYPPHFSLQQSFNQVSVIIIIIIIIIGSAECRESVRDLRQDWEEEKIVELLFMKLCEFSF